MPSLYYNRLSILSRQQQAEGSSARHWKKSRAHVNPCRERKLPLPLVPGLWSLPSPFARNLLRFAFICCRVKGELHSHELTVCLILCSLSYCHVALLAVALIKLSQGFAERATLVT